MYKIGSARSDERGKYSGGKAGDQKQDSIFDVKGELSIQDFYVHSKGWNIIRCKDKKIRTKIGEKMILACMNKNIGYSQGGQSNRYGIIKYGIETTTPCNADCSSTARQCVKEASGIDPGDFNTANEATVLKATGLFDVIPYTSGMKLYKGDILVTRTKGHTVIVTEGEETATTEEKPKKETKKETVKYYPKYSGSSESIITALKAVGEKDTSMKHRKLIAAANNISEYTGTAAQNMKLLAMLKNGKLTKA